MNSETRVVWGRRATVRAATLLLPLWLVLSAAPSSALPVWVDLNYTTVGGTGTAVAAIQLDDSLLRPNVVGFVNCDLSLIYSFSMTITGLITTPSSTSFTKADLGGYYISTDGGGNITDLNFFMLDSTCPPDHYNADGYALNGATTFRVELHRHIVGDGDQIVADFLAASS